MFTQNLTDIENNLNNSNKLESSRKNTDLFLKNSNNYTFGKFDTDYSLKKNISDSNFQPSNFKFGDISTKTNNMTFLNKKENI